MPVSQKEIAARREKLGLTMEEAAARAGFTGPNARIRWYEVESGKIADPRASTLEKVAGALGCRVDDLLVKRADKAAAREQKDKAPAQKRSSRSGSAGSKG